MIIKGEVAPPPSNETGETKLMTEIQCCTSKVAFLLGDFGDSIRLLIRAWIPSRDLEQRAQMPQGFTKAGTNALWNTEKAERAALTSHQEPARRLHWAHFLSSIYLFCLLQGIRCCVITSALLTHGGKISAEQASGLSSLSHLVDPMWKVGFE